MKKETKTLDIFGHTSVELFESVRNAIEKVEQAGATDFELHTTWSQICNAYVGQLTYYIYY